MAVLMTVSMLCGSVDDCVPVMVVLMTVFLCYGIADYSISTVAVFMMEFLSIYNVDDRVSVKGVTLSLMAVTMCRCSVNDCVPVMW